MKKIIFLLIYLFTGIGVFAQNQAIVDYKYKVDTSITGKTAPKSVTPLTVGGRLKDLADLVPRDLKNIGDSIIALVGVDSILWNKRYVDTIYVSGSNIVYKKNGNTYTLAIPASQSLQQVTTVGAATTDPITVGGLTINGVMTGTGTDVLIVTAGGVVQKTTISTLYNTDGSLTTDRNVDGNSHFLRIAGLSDFRLGAASSSIGISSNGITIQGTNSTINTGDSIDIGVSSGTTELSSTSTRLAWKRLNGGIYIDKFVVDTTGVIKASNYKNNVAEDSVLSVDANGKFKLKLTGGGTNIYNSNGTLTSRRYLTGNNIYDLNLDSLTGFAARDNLGGFVQIGGGIGRLASNSVVRLTTGTTGSFTEFIMGLGTYQFNSSNFLNSDTNRVLTTNSTGYLGYKTLPSLTNIYSGDGTLASNRAVDGNGNSLTWSNLSSEMHRTSSFFAAQSIDAGSTNQGTLQVTPTVAGLSLASSPGISVSTVLQTTPLSEGIVNGVSQTGGRVSTSTFQGFGNISSTVVLNSDSTLFTKGTFGVYVDTLQTYIGDGNGLSVTDGHFLSIGPRAGIDKTGFYVSPLPNANDVLSAQGFPLHGLRDSAYLRVQPDSVVITTSNVLLTKLPNADTTKFLTTDASGNISLKTAKPVDMVTLTGPQTLINKTLNAPVINIAPSDNVGDMYYRSISGQLERLAAGPENSVLKIVGGIPTWVLDGVAALQIAAGADQSLASGVTSTTLTSSVIQGTPTSYQWSLDSGPVNQGINPDARAFVPLHTYELVPDGTGRLVLDGSSYVPGDLLLLNGDFKSIELSNVTGSSTTPIVIQNKPGVKVHIGDTSWNGGSYAEAFKILNCKYFRLWGTSVDSLIVTGTKTANATSKTAYYDLIFNNYTDNFRVCYLTITDGGTGLWCKKEVDAGDPNSWYPARTLSNIEIDNIIINGNNYNEGMYLGHTGIYWNIVTNQPYYPQPGDPTPDPSVYKQPILINNLKVHNNIVRNTGGDGVQLAATNNLEVRDNEITNWATRNVFTDNGGLLLGGRITNWTARNNYIHDGWGDGSQIYVSGDGIFRNNLLVNVGQGSTATNTGAEIISMRGTDNAVVTIDSNSLVNPQNTSIRINGYYGMTYPQIINNNIFAGIAFRDVYTENGGTYSMGTSSQANDEYSTVAAANLDPGNWYLPATSTNGYRHTAAVGLIGSSLTFGTPTASSTTVSGLSIGEYLFRITARDAANSTSTGTTKVTVIP